MAGAPFELDGTGPTLPHDERTRWCAHQRLIDDTRLQIAEFQRADDDPLGILPAIEAIDRGRANFIAEQLTQVTKESLAHVDAIAKRIEFKWDFKGFDLRLLPRVKRARDIRPAGKKRGEIIVADVNNVLYFRIFDPAGSAVVKTDEKKLTKATRQIEDLKKLLVDLWHPHKLVASEADRVMSDLASIIG
jgi:hypothetical protein